MAYNINAKFFKFAKKPNSTRLPTEQSTTMLERSVEIIEPFDLLNPTIKVVDCWTDAVKDTWTYFMQFNYVKLGDTTGPGREVDRYYWIKNWRREGGVNFAECEVDVLASWRGTIHGFEGHPNKQLVERCSAAVDYTLRDNLRPTLASCSHKSANMTKISGQWAYEIDGSQTPVFVSMHPCITGVKYKIPGIWRFSGATYPVLEKNMSISLGVGEGAGFKASNLTVADFIDYAYKLPYDLNVGNLMSEIYFGILEAGQPYVKVSGVSCGPVTDTNKIVGLWEWTVSGLPSEAWLATEEYVNITISMKPFGTIQVPMSLIKNASKLNVLVEGDCFGNVTCEIYGSTSSGTITERFIAGSSNVALNIGKGVTSQVSQAMINRAMNRVAYEAGKSSTMLKNALAGSIISFNPSGAMSNLKQLGFVDTDAAWSRVDALSSLISSVRVSSSPASGTCVITDPVINITINNVAPAQNDKYGRPLHKVRELSTLVANDNQPGFVQCSDANIDNEDYTTYGRNGSASMTVTEKTAICNFLNGGVYLE